MSSAYKAQPVFYLHNIILCLVTKLHNGSLLLTSDCMVIWYACFLLLYSITFSLSVIFSCMFSMFYVFVYFFLSLTMDYVSEIKIRR